MTDRLEPPKEDRARADDPNRDRLRALLGDIMLSDSMMSTLHVLCDVIGRRPAGSEAEAAARDYLVGELERFGLQGVRAEPFHAPHWKRGFTTARMSAPVSKPIELLALPLNRSHKVEAEVAPVSFRTEQEFEQIASQLRGKICINLGETTTGAGKDVLHRSERIRLAHQAGAAAFLWSSHIPGHVLPTGSMNREIAKEMPAFGISLEDAKMLERFMERGHTVSLEIETVNELREGTSWNVVADLPGASPDAPWVYVTAHYDSHDITTGAYDNAAGAAIVLECARVFASHYAQAGCNVRFIVFSAEEVSLVGSTKYVEQHADELSSIRFLLNADGLGVVPSTKYIHVPFHRPAAAYIREVYRRYGYSVDVDNAINLNWDHAPFAVRGVPVGSITAKGRPGQLLHYGHTVSDSLDKIDAQDMRYAASCTALLAYQFAVDGACPVVQLSAAEVRSAAAEARPGALDLWLPGASATAEAAR